MRKYGKDEHRKKVRIEKRKGWCEVRAAGYACVARQDRPARLSGPTRPTPHPRCHAQGGADRDSGTGG